MIARALDLFSAGDYEGAVEVAREALQADPTNARGHEVLGAALLRLGRWSDAEPALKTAAHMAPMSAGPLRNLALVYRHRGDAIATLDALWRAIGLDPDHQDTWIAFSEALASAEFTDTESADAGSMAGIVQACLLRDGLDPTRLVRAAYAVLSNDPAIRGALSGGDVDAAVLDALSQPLPIAALSRVVLPFADWERLIGRARRAMLDLVVQRGSAEQWRDLSLALARQGFLSGWILPVSADEKDGLERVAGGLDAVTGPAAQARLALLSSYAPMLSWVETEHALRVAADPPETTFLELVTQQVEGPLVEDDLKSRIPRWTEVSDDVSQTVRAQYEEHPYPRWTTVARPTAVTLREHLGALLPAQAGRLQLPETGTRMLVAGCGTGQQVASILTRYRDVEVVAVDLSLSSLAYAARQLGSLGLERVALGQADILGLADWDERFDCVVSTGVIHHMENPADGLEVLTRLLEPGGVMKLALYSEAARQGVVAARAEIERLGVPATREGIRSFRTRVLDEFVEREPWNELLRWPDFYVLEECRDLLFHPMEHRYTVEGLERLVVDAGLELLGFDVPADVRTGFRERFTDPAAEYSFEAWAEYERHDPGAFRAMYQLWLRKPTTGRRTSE